MAKKRKDQRFAVDETVEKQVFSLLDQDVVESLVAARDALDNQIQSVIEALQAAPTDLFAQSLARGTGRRGESRFEIDPDGKMVLIVSYGGETSDPLSRSNALTPAWNKRNERKKKASSPKAEEPKKRSGRTIEILPDEPTPPPPKKKGFIKTSVAVSETKVVELDDLLEGFDEEPEEKEPEIDTVVYESTYTPPKKRLKRIPGQPVRKGGNSKTKLSDLPSIPSPIENGDEPQ